MKTKRGSLLLIALALVVTTALPIARYGNAFADAPIPVTFTVNSILDTPDDNPGDGVCDDGAGLCTLRAAIQEANASSGYTTTVHFAIAGAGLHTIDLETGLPPITQSIHIDGTTQTGASCGTLVPSLPANSNTPHTLMVEVRSDNIASGNSNIFDFEDAGASHSSVKGMILSRFQGYASGVLMNSSNDQNPLVDIDINCNYFGTNQAGTVAAVIGGGTGVTVQPWVTQVSITNNLFSGGWTVGLSTQSPVTIENNLIGVTANGQTALPNLYGYSGGIEDDTKQVHLNNNVISGNSTKGMVLRANNVVENNFIGLSLNGQPLGNGEDGIFLGEGARNNIVGSSSSHNVISANGDNGILVWRADHCQSIIKDNKILGNRIGTNAAGAVTAGFGNESSGIMVHENDGSCGGSVYKTQIGGDAAAEENTIAGNAEDGIQIFSVPWQECDDGEGGTTLCHGTDVFSAAILGNSIFKNGNLGINLATDTQDNGVADEDLGPNTLNSFGIDYPATHANSYLNHPVVNSATITPSDKLVLNYNFQAPAVTTNTEQLQPSDLIGFRIDVYANDMASDGSYPGYAQGKIHIGSFIIDGSATNAEHIFDTLSMADLHGKHITANATILWKVIPESNDECDGTRYGNGPPYEVHQAFCT